MSANRIPNQDRATDYGFIAIVGFVAAIVVWLLLMPFVPTIAESTINRFHFRTQSFPLWVIQQPIPAMYNLANHYEVTRESETGEKEILESGTINHFPARVVTFANGRYRTLHERQACDLQVTSSYRGQRQRTYYRLTPNENGGFAMHQIHALEMAR